MSHFIGDFLEAQGLETSAASQPESCQRFVSYDYIIFQLHYFDSDL